MAIELDEIANEKLEKKIIVSIEEIELDCESKTLTEPHKYRHYLQVGTSPKGIFYEIRGKMQVKNILVIISVIGGILVTLKKVLIKLF